MRFALRPWGLCRCLAVFLLFSLLEHGRADDTVLMAYGGHNETIGPYWVAIDKGLYQKHGIDARLLQVRNAQISLAALVSGEVDMILDPSPNDLPRLRRNRKSSTFRPRPRHKRQQAAARRIQIQRHRVPRRRPLRNRSAARVAFCNASAGASASRWRSWPSATAS